MKKLLLTFLFCMIGFSSYSLELYCEFIKENYYKKYDPDKNVLKTEERYLFENIVMVIENNKCEWISDEGKGDSTFFDKLRKTTDAYVCVKNQEAANLKLILRFEIDRYSGASEFLYSFMLSGSVIEEYQRLYQCEKSKAKGKQKF